MLEEGEVRCGADCGSGRPVPGCPGARVPGCPGARCPVPSARVPGARVPGCRVPGARVPGARGREPDELAEKGLKA